MRFSLKQTLLGLTAACAWLSIFKLAGGENAFLLLNVLIFFTLCGVAIARPERAIVWVLPLQSFLLLCLGVLIASYHINGRALYDYGLRGWSPPPSYDENGVPYTGDYDPKFTRPFVWPWIGDGMAILSEFAMGSMIIPPTAPLCPVVLIILLRTHRTYPKAIRDAATMQVFVALLLMFYLACSGLKILEWLGD